MKKIDKDVQYILTKYGKTFTALGKEDAGIKEKIKWAEKEYKDYLKNGWRGKEVKGKAIEWIDFITYLKNKYK
jgi:hypothetical protein